MNVAKSGDTSILENELHGSLEHGIANPVAAMSPINQSIESSSPSATEHAPEIHSADLRSPPSAPTGGNGVPDHEICWLLENAESVFNQPTGRTRSQTASVQDPTNASTIYTLHSSAGAPIVDDIDAERHQNSATDSDDDDNAELTILSHLFLYLVGLADEPTEGFALRKLNNEELQQSFLAELQKWKKRKH